MKNIKIYLNSQKDILDFNKIITRYECDFDLEVGHSYIDAKSLLGIYSLTLKRPLTLHIQADQKMADDVILNLHDYVCEEELV